MQDKYEIEIYDEGVHVWGTNWRGSALAADITMDMTRKQIAQEIYDLLAISGHEVRFREED